MANSWTLTVIVLLSIFMARSQTRGDQATASHQNKDSAIKQLTDFKEQTFIPGNDVILQCGNVTDINWNELIYIVWNISLQDRKCWLGLSPKLDDKCKDGKRLYNTSDGVYLVIPKISTEDEGFYSCDVSYKAGSYAVNVSVNVINVSTQLYREKIAVCRATYTQKTAPTLHWEPALNFSTSISSVEKLGRFFMMENRIYLPDNVNISELTCVATYTSKSGSVQHKSTLHLKQNSSTGTQETSSFPSKIIAISVGSVCFILVSLAVVYILCRKLKDLSALKMLCCKSKISTPAEDKPPQPADVEEVEPYASYIQRVNSIYNSSAELFNA
ncbi:cell surface glycoprotein CD200 receptor 1-A [Sinocyclocheilus anshuiensis]|uniref:cell surface glycoprotein CD200 receptor 1-A n=1 Tax=Sinocyclocheilus anshuiensis TaxID=1608454 RepID=UPI0007B9CE9E|nr:PREDICTED: cell surface glycoprotein CD200 receptor 1-A-like [Sinocyclocheilus anshuiensis]